MDIERERGITIKSQAISLPYQAKDGEDTLFSISSTPPVMSISPMRSPAPWPPAKGYCSSLTPPRACRPRRSPISILAMENNLEVIPVINKIDLPSADVERVIEQIDSELGLDPYCI